MAWQKMEGDLWDQSLGLELLPPIALASGPRPSPLCKIWGALGAETHV